MTSENGIKTDLEVLLDLMLRPQYNYKMAVGRLNGPKSNLHESARRIRDKALKELESLIHAYYNGRIRQVAKKVQETERN